MASFFSFVPCLDKDANGSAVRRADPVVLRDEVIPEVDVRQRSFLDRLAEISDVINDNGQLFLPLAEVLTGFDSDCDVHQTFDSPVSYISLFPAILSAIEVPPSRYPMSLS